MGDFELIWVFCAYLMHSYGRFEICMRDSRNCAAQPDPCFMIIIAENEFLIYTGNHTI